MLEKQHGSYFGSHYFLFYATLLNLNFKQFSHLHWAVKNRAAILYIYKKKKISIPAIQNVDHHMLNMGHNVAHN